MTKIRKRWPRRCFCCVFVLWTYSGHRSNNQAERWLQCDQRRSTACVGCQGSRNFSEKWTGRATRLLHRRHDGGDGLDLGDTPLSQVAGSAVVNSVLSGSDAAIVAAGITSLNYYLMARPDIKTPEQLKGGSVAISRFGSSSDFIARFALSKIGLTPGKDVTIVQIGSTPDRVAAVLTGRVQATVQSAGEHHRGKKGDEDPGGSAQARIGLPAYYRRHDPKIYSRASRCCQALCEIADRGGTPNLHRQGNLD